MENNLKQKFKKYLEDSSNIRQNSLMQESEIISFAKERGVSLSGLETGDPSKFLKINWISLDGVNESDKVLFHPFRIYPFHIAIEMCRLNISASSSIDRASFEEFLGNASNFLPSLETIENMVRLANEISDLAILLEPIYWPEITNMVIYIAPITEEEYESKVEQYKNSILAVIKELDPDVWFKHHECLRMTAAQLDNNSELYILLRLAPWKKREKIIGKIGAALWLRHIAEVIRLAFTEVYNVNWPEEYEAYGMWYEGARKRIYGTEKPIDDRLLARPHLAFEFGLYTGSTIRWYLEGETEYEAASYALPKAALGGIELINIKGIFKENQRKLLRLVDNLYKDKEHRRFSFISFDKDVSTNVNFLQNQVREGNIVGYINCNNPDFEFENFTLEELIEVAVSIDEKDGLAIDKLRNGRKDGINSGKEFEKYYSQYSETKRPLKGSTWGKHLAEYALTHPLKEDTKLTRPFIETINYAIRSRNVRYEYQRDYFYIDPDDFTIKSK